MEDEQQTVFIASGTELGGVAEPSDPGRASERARLRPGTRVGRYIVLESIGKGGMGVVYRAHDPELERTIALKLLRRPTTDANAPDAAQARLVREARTLAALSHPNVVAVFDVLTFQAQVVLAMELVEGVTLRAWLQSATRSCADVLSMFLPAGRGLAAAHAVGIVHRDFKPANVLIGTDGRVRVADFGLARSTASTRSRPTSSSSGRGSWSTGDDTSGSLTALNSDLGSRMTRTGDVMGTPLFMSPEQHAGAAVDPASDQYSFCVALWQAVCGHSPFPTADRRALVRAKVAGPIAPGAPVGVPKHVVAAMMRGLSPRPQARFPTMDALLAALTEDRSGRRRRRGALAAGAAVVGVAALAMAWPRSRDLCGGADGAWGDAWDAGRAARAHQAMTSSARPHAAQAWSRVESALDDYARRWKEVHRDACEAHVRGDQSEVQLDARMACLDQARRDVVSLGDLLARADDDVVLNSVTAVRALPSIASCEAPASEGASRFAPADPQLRAEIDRLREQLADARALLAGGKYDDALLAVLPVEAAARSLDHAPTLADVLLVLGQALAKDGRHDEALARLEEAEYFARASGNDAVLSRVLNELVYLTGQVMGRAEDALARSRHAMAIVDRLDSGAAKGRLLNSIGNVLEREGRYDEALASYKEAQSLLAAAEGEDSPEVARSLNNQGNALFHTSERQAAAGVYEAAHRTWAAALGDDHPDVVMPLNNLAATKIVRGDVEGAKSDLERVLAVWRAAYDRDHFRLSIPLHNLGSLERRLENFDMALERDLEALRLREKTLGPDHPDVAQTLQSLGVDYLQLERWAESAAHSERGVAVWERTLGPDHVKLASALANLALARINLPDPENALPPAERSLRLREGSLAKDAPQIAFSLYPYAVVVYRLGRPDDATAPLERAIALAEAHPDTGASGQLGGQCFDLARLYVELGERGDRVEPLLECAVAAYRDGRDDERVAEVERWRAEKLPRCRRQRCRADLRG